MKFWKRKRRGTDGILELDVGEERAQLVLFIGEGEDLPITRRKRDGDLVSAARTNNLERGWGGDHKPEEKQRGSPQNISPKQIETQRRVARQENIDGEKGRE